MMALTMLQIHAFSLLDFLEYYTAQSSVVPESCGKRMRNTLAISTVLLKRGVIWVAAWFSARSNKPNLGKLQESL